MFQSTLCFSVFALVGCFLFFLFGPIRLTPTQWGLSLETVLWPFRVYKRTFLFCGSYMAWRDSRGHLSCCGRNPWPSRRRSGGFAWCCEMWRSFFWWLCLAFWTSSASSKTSQSITFPFLCLTVRVTYWGTNLLPTRRHSNTLHEEFELLNHKTFLQSSVAQPSLTSLCTLRNVLNALLCNIVQVLLLVCRNSALKATEFLGHLYKLFASTSKAFLHYFNFANLTFKFKPLSVIHLSIISGHPLHLQRI